jgi:hypothetical protein
MTAEDLKAWTSSAVIDRRYSQSAQIQIRKWTKVVALTL